MLMAIDLDPRARRSAGRPSCRRRRRGPDYTALCSADGETCRRASSPHRDHRPTVTAPRWEPRPGPIANDGVNTGEATSAVRRPDPRPRWRSSGCSSPVEQYDPVELNVSSTTRGRRRSRSPRNRLGTDRHSGRPPEARCCLSREVPVGAPRLRHRRRRRRQRSVAEGDIEVVERTSPARYTETADPETVEFLANEFNAPRHTTTTRPLTMSPPRSRRRRSPPPTPTATG